MLVSTKDSVNFFCTEKNQFTYHRKFDFSIKLAEKLTDECFVIITENDRLEICSKFGNKLFQQYPRMIAPLIRFITTH